MQVQKVFRAGNSNVIAIPKDLSEELGIKPGQKVVVEKDPNGEGVIMRKAGKVKVHKLAVDKEFKKWWDIFIEENAEILDELAVR